MILNRDRSRSPTRSNIEFRMIKVNGWKSSTIIKETSTSNPARVLDLTLIIIKMVYKLNGLSKKLVLKQSHPKPISIM